MMRRAALLVSGWALLLGVAGVFAQQEAPLPDVGGVAAIQEIPVRITDFFVGDVAKRVLDSLANLAVLQMELEGFTIASVDPDSGEERVYLGGEFGRLIQQEILAFDPEGDEGLLVEHIELVQTPGLTPEFDEDRYRMTVGDREIELLLGRAAGRPDKGFEWGVVELRNRRPAEDGDASDRTLSTELIINNNTATITQRVFAANGRLLSLEQWDFELGEPEPVSHSGP